MTENARTTANIKGQLSRFSGIISKGFSKAKQQGSICLHSGRKQYK